MNDDSLYLLRKVYEQKQLLVEAQDRENDPQEIFETIIPAILNDNGLFTTTDTHAIISIINDVFTAMYPVDMRFVTPTQISWARKALIKYISKKFPGGAMEIVFNRANHTVILRLHPPSNPPKIIV